MLAMNHFEDLAAGRFLFLLRVRYSECDMQRVVFNAWYAQYVDVAVTEYIRAMFGDVEHLTKRGLGYQVVSHTLEWKSAAVFDEVIALAVETTRLGNTSFTLKVELVEAFSGRPIAVSTATHVMVLEETLQKLSIPDDVRQKLAAGAGGVIVNHAGIDITR
jgi:acyl-CoA thioester hydrolase